MTEPCIMKDELTKAVEGIKTQNRWFMGIFGGAVILLLVGYGALGSGHIATKTQITKINDDYAPLMIIQDIMESSDKSNQIILMIPQTAKDDPRYLEAINDREKFQREAIQRISSVKRGNPSGNKN